MSARAGRTLRGGPCRELTDVPITRLNRLSEKKAKALEDWGIASVFDLLTTYPHRYIDRSRQADLADLAVGDEAVVLATVRRVSARRTRNRRSLVELAADDGTGTMKVVFFNQPWRAKQLVAGTEALFFGKLDEYRGARQMTNPVVDVLVATDDDADGRRRRTLRVIPVYPASGKAGLSSWEVGEWVEQAIRRAGDFADPLPDAWRDRLDLIGRTDAMWRIHLPETVGRPPPRPGAGSPSTSSSASSSPSSCAAAPWRPMPEPSATPSPPSTSSPVPGPPAPARHSRPCPGPTGRSCSASLPACPSSSPTSQRRALASIFAELAGPLPMHRLLQGDVGSGKTVVAVAALLAAVQGGHQGALMVPTEVLAEQHHMAVRALARRPDRPRPRPARRRSARSPSRC